MSGGGNFKKEDFSQLNLVPGLAPVAKSELSLSLKKNGPKKKKRTLEEKYREVLKDNARRLYGNDDWVVLPDKNENSLSNTLIRESKKLQPFRQNFPNLFVEPKNMETPAKDAKKNLADFANNKEVNDNKKVNSTSNKTVKKRTRPIPIGRFSYKNVLVKRRKTMPKPVDITDKWREALEDNELWDKNDQVFNRQMALAMEEKDRLDKEAKIQKMRGYLRELSETNKQRKARELDEIAEQKAREASAIDSRNPLSKFNSKLTEGVSQADHSFLDSFGDGIGNYYKQLNNEAKENKKKSGWDKVWGAIKFGLKATLAPGMAIASAFKNSYKGSDLESLTQLAGKFDPRAKAVGNVLDTASNVGNLVLVDKNEEKTE